LRTAATGFQNSSRITSPARQSGSAVVGERVSDILGTSFLLQVRKSLLDYALVPASMRKRVTNKEEIITK
jgi:hypothetical protein